MRTVVAEPIILYCHFFLIFAYAHYLNGWDVDVFEKIRQSSCYFDLNNLLFRLAWWKRKDCDGGKYGMKYMRFVVVAVLLFTLFLSRLLYLAYSSNLDLLCMPHPGMGPQV